MKPHLAFTTMFLLAACGGGTTASPIDGGSHSDGGGSACNGVANAAPVVSHAVQSGPTPSMTGGTIADGTYFLTSMDLYNGHTGGEDHQETWVISGGHLDAAAKVGTELEENSSGDLVTSGNQLTIQVTCPTAATLTGSTYTATATELQIIFFDGPDDVRTYTKQ